MIDLKIIWVNPITLDFCIYFFIHLFFNFFSSNSFYVCKIVFSVLFVPSLSWAGSLNIQYSHCYSQFCSQVWYLQYQKWSQKQHGSTVGGTAKLLYWMAALNECSQDVADPSQNKWFITKRNINITMFLRLFIKLKEEQEIRWTTKQWHI